MRVKGIVVFIIMAWFVICSVATHASTPGTSDNGLLAEEWHYDMQWYSWGYFGSSPAVADLGGDVNNVSGEPSTDLEIVTGSDENVIPLPDGSGGWAAGLWYCFDSQGGLEWFTDTQSDESRGSIAIIDINGDGYLEIVGGTTSGETVEVMDRFGNFIWTFPDPPHIGAFMWPAAPAVADVDAGNSGLEVIIGNRPLGIVYALDGDNTDGVDDGYTWPGGDPWTGTEGIDWDILWTYNLGVEIFASTAVGDVDGDGTMEAVVGSTNGNFVVLNAFNGTLEHSFFLGSIYASAALADLDGNGLLDIIIGSINGTIYCLEWDGSTSITKWTYATAGPVYSSAAVGDVDGDGSLDVVVGSSDDKVYCLNASGEPKWTTQTGGDVYSSPSLARRNVSCAYGNEWPMFRSNPARTGLYGGSVGSALGVYVGSEDEYFYLIDGANGNVIDRFRVRHNTNPWWYQGVHTSAAVADVDGDLKLEFFFTDWGNTSDWDGHTFWAVEDKGYVLVAIDIKPGSCPNPLNIKLYRDNTDEVESRSLARVGPVDTDDEDRAPVLPVAILGAEDFDVTLVDPSTVTLKGVPALRWNYEDVSTPMPDDAEKCECNADGPDGYTDLTLKFDKASIIAALGDVHDGDVVPLFLHGQRLDGMPIGGVDCVIIRSRRYDASSTSAYGELGFDLEGNYPNPFNPATGICFTLPKTCHVSLEIYNLLGRKVATLVDRMMEPGRHTVTWYSADAASGVYLYRLTAGEFTGTRKMLLVR